MKLYAFAALLALPLLGLSAGGASADYYCCGKEKGENYTKYAYVHKDSAVFGCDGYHCQTDIKVFGGTKVKVFCRNGWCNIKNYPFANVWVLENCLKFDDYGFNDGNGYGRYGYKQENGNGDDEGYEGYEGGEYRKHGRHYPKY